MLKVIATSDPSESMHETQDLNFVPLPVLPLSAAIGAAKQAIHRCDCDAAHDAICKIQDMANDAVLLQIKEFTRDQLNAKRARFST